MRSVFLGVLLAAAAGCAGGPSAEEARAGVRWFATEGAAEWRVLQDAAHGVPVNRPNRMHALEEVDRLDGLGTASGVRLDTLESVTALAWVWAHTGIDFPANGPRVSALTGDDGNPLPERALAIGRLAEAARGLAAIELRSGAAMEVVSRELPAAARDGLADARERLERQPEWTPDRALLLEALRGYESISAGDFADPDALTAHRTEDPVVAAEVVLLHGVLLALHQRWADAEQALEAPAQRDWPMACRFRLVAAEAQFLGTDHTRPDAGPKIERLVALYDHEVRRSPESDRAVGGRAKALRLLADWRATRGQGGLDVYERALAGFDRALEANPAEAGWWSSRAFARLSYARTLRRTGRSPLAQFPRIIADLEHAARLNPGDTQSAAYRPAVLQEWGMAEKAAGRDPLPRWREAAAAFKAVLETDPDNLRALHGVAGIHIETGDVLMAQRKPWEDEYRAAIPYYDRAVALKSPWHHTWRNRGVAHLLLKNYPEALADLEEALRRGAAEGWIPGQVKNLREGLAKQRADEEKKKD